MADSEGAGDCVASAFDSGSIGDEQLERPFHPPVPYPFPNAPTFQPADNVVHPPHSSGELKARPGLHFESPVFGPSAAETSDSKRAPEQPRRSVTPAKDDKQQFHGNGSELLQLLQGGPGRVKPTASTKVDATQDSGDSGEPSKKGSPSAVHGPTGSPRRHVVAPPQSPNDLLGRLWPALPSSSHTLFDGGSERKASARSFGVEVNEMSREVDGAKGIGACRLALPLNGYDYNDSNPRTNSASGRLQDYRGRYVNGEAEFEPGGDDFRGGVEVPVVQTPDAVLGVLLASALRAQSGGETSLKPYPKRHCWSRALLLLERPPQLRPAQWTAFLDLLEIPLKRKNFCFVRLDGTLSQRQREQVLKNFGNIPAVAPSSESRMWTIEHRSDEERIDQAIHRQRSKRKQRLIAGALTDEEVSSRLWRTVKELAIASQARLIPAASATSKAIASIPLVSAAGAARKPGRILEFRVSGVISHVAGSDSLIGSWKPRMNWAWMCRLPAAICYSIFSSGGGDEQLRSSSSDRTQQSQLTVPATALLLLEDLEEEEEKPADNVVHPPHSSGELKARPGLHFESPVFGPSAAETSDSKRAPEQPRRSVTPEKDDTPQFHGNGSELLQLLQGGPGRVKPTASTKVDATQDSGDSGEPSKKGSPSAVHGPIGSPRRHVVAPPQSPNDLLGRLWAALPSSSHTLFDGESERKTSAWIDHRL
ncbi:hypothetical protein SELMODRAFT_430940 [Selaginella moellendorffii]|uniref:Uncharacterized protein n=1 Tax=Selaginella moellendorffii TaxID=88036 RepID=D8TB09_SELML|nr:hypothetical protein SELMODRAFT_430940 [Selaginella moellendorffii]